MRITGDRRAGNVVAGAVVAVLASAPLAPMHPATAAQSVAPGVATAAGQAGPKVVHVDYGDVVEVPEVDDRTGAVTLRFDGRKGTWVSTGIASYGVPCEKQRLSIGGRRVDRNVLGFWRLPRTGTYRLTYRHHCMDVSPGGVQYLSSMEVRVRRLVLHPGRVGQRLRTRETRSTVHAYRVPVPRGVRAAALGTADPFQSRHQAFPASWLTRPWRGWSLSRGRPCGPLVASAPLRLDCPWSIRRDDAYVVIGTGATTVRPLAWTRVPVDGAEAAWKGAGPRLLAFRAEAGSHVRVSATNLDLRPAGDEYGDDPWPLFTRFGDSLAYTAAFVAPDALTHDLVLQPTRSGRHLLVLHGAVRDRHEKVSVSVHSVAETAVEPGAEAPIEVSGDRWSLATLPTLLTPGLRARLSVLSADGMAAGWGAHLLGGESAGEITTRVVGTLTAVGSLDWAYPGGHPHAVLVTPGPGHTRGTVTARVDTRIGD